MYGIRRRWFELLWLIFLFVPIVSLAEMSLERAIRGYVLIALFCFTYWQATRSERATRWQIALILAIVFALGWRYDAGNLNMLFFAAPFLAQRPTRQELFAWTGLIIVGIAVSYLFVLRPFNLDLFLTNLPFLVIMLLLPFIIQSARRSRELQAELNAANARNANLLRQEERHRIAKDLHDTLGHTLSLIVLKSELAERLIQVDPARAEAEIRTVRETARKALREAREVVSQMRSVTLQAELAAAAELLATAGIQFTPQVGEVALSPLVENMLGFCLREAVTNVVRHSGANSCHVSLGAERGFVVLTIADDGAGIGPECSSGTGLASIRDRLQLVEGTLTVEGPPGTTLRLQVPTVVRGGALHG